MGELVYPIIGWLSLWVWYRNKSKVKQVLDEKYENSYYYAGAELSIKAFAVLLGTLLAGFLVVVIGRLIFDVFN
jgi:hypothetical protein